MWVSIDRHIKCRIMGSLSLGQKSVNPTTLYKIILYYILFAKEKKKNAMTLTFQQLNWVCWVLHKYEFSWAELTARPWIEPSVYWGWCPTPAGTHCILDPPLRMTRFPVLSSDPRWRIFPASDVFQGTTPCHP